MTRILGVSGSLRKDSFNTRLLREAAALSGNGVEIEVATLHGIPLYNADDEAASGLPDAVIELKEKIVACDGLLLSTPEYNHGIPGVFKNGIDWLSRPNADIARVFAGRPVALIGATPSGFGTLSAQAAWLPVFRTLRLRPWFGAAIRLSKANTAFDADGRLHDDAMRVQLADFVAGFAAFCATSEQAEVAASAPRD